MTLKERLEAVWNIEGCCSPCHLNIWSETPVGYLIYAEFGLFWKHGKKLNTLYRKPKMTKLFVWISGLRGPEAQLWDELKQEGNKPVKYLACYSVDGSASLNEYKVMYPFEAKE